jgi:hypothetical protein
VNFKKRVKEKAEGYLEYSYDRKDCFMVGAQFAASLIVEMLNNAGFNTNTLKENNPILKHVFDSGCCAEWVKKEIERENE